MKDFRKLQAWKKSHELVLQIYKLTEKSPSKEVYGLTAQLRRAAISIPTNIAEGYGRTTDAEIARFIDISSGSVNEVDYLLFLAMELKYTVKAEVENMTEKLIETRKMLTAFAKTLRGFKQKAGSR